MTVLHPGQLSIDVGFSRVALRPRKLPIKEGGVGFVLEVMEPGVWGCAGRGGHGTDDNSVKSEE
jgi:hypothetical protein